MNTDRRTALVVGVLFILATAFSLINTALVGSLIGAADYIARVSANGNQMIIGALIELAAAVSVVLIPAMLFPVLRRFNEGVALGYFGFRILEAITLIIGAVSSLLLVSLSRQYLSAGAAATSDYQHTGALLQAAYNWVSPLNPIVFGPGALLLYSVLYQSRLIPRWLSAWGLIGAALVFVLGLLGMFGTAVFGSIVIVLAIPIAVQEMVMAIWLIVKGFTPSALASGPAEIREPSWVPGAAR
jgi:hypothetical protein